MVLHMTKPTLLVLAAGMGSRLGRALPKPLTEHIVWDREVPGMIVSHTVANLDAWLAGYQAAAPVQKQAGIIGQAANQSLDAPNTVVVYHQAVPQVLERIAKDYNLDADELVSKYVKAKARAATVVRLCGGIAILDPEKNFEPVAFLQFNKDSKDQYPVERIDKDFLTELIDRQVVPVVSPVAFGPDGKSLRVNSDLLAAELAALRVPDFWPSADAHRSWSLATPCGSFTRRRGARSCARSG